MNESGMKSTPPSKGCCDGLTMEPGTLVSMIMNAQSPDLLCKHCHSGDNKRSVCELNWDFMLLWLKLTPDSFKKIKYPSLVLWVGIVAKKGKTILFFLYYLALAQIILFSHLFIYIYRLSLLLE
jgi:hypothetical protein